MSSSIGLLLCALLSSAAALNIGGPAPPRPSIGAMRDAAVRGAMASSLALALSTANPAFTAADVPAPSAAVERAGFSLVADSDQEKFLAERAKMKTQYEQDLEGTYMTASRRPPRRPPTRRWSMASLRSPLWHR